MSKFITSDPPYNAGLYPTTAGFLKLADGVALSSTLTNVTDQLNTASTLYLSTDEVRIGTTARNTPLSLFGVKNFTATFNVSQINVTDKTFTFPDANMTFAGINISQTFTAAQTFNSPSASGTDGSPIRILTDPWTTGNGNQNHPLLLFGPHGGNIWAASPNGGTYIGINAVASFPGNFLDFHVNGGASLFKVAASGAVTSTSTITGTNFNVAGTGGRYSFDNSQYIDGTTFSNVIFHRSNANGHRFNVNGTDILNILSTGLSMVGPLNTNRDISNVNLYNGATVNTTNCAAITYRDSGFGAAGDAVIWATCNNTVLNGVSGGTMRLTPPRTISSQIQITPPTPLPCAIMQLESTNQGFLPPRMTTVQRDAIGQFPITAIIGLGTLVLFTCLNNFLPGESVTISGATTSAYNITGTIVSANSKFFTISSTATGASSTATATAAKVAGLTIYNTTTNLLSTWNGTTWIER
jgi:hypothetical protein